MQRERMLAAMEQVVGERGFAGCSVEAVIARAGVSRRTFYEQFDGLQDCFLAVLDRGAETVIGLVSGAFDGRESWLDGLRWALASLLALFDSEPLLARVWLVESMAAGGWALEHRERKLRDLFQVISDAWPLPDSLQPGPLVIEGVFASVRSIVAQRLISASADVHGGKGGGPLIELLAPLMGLIAGPFLGKRAVELEIARSERLARAIAAGDPSGGVQVARVVGGPAAETSDGVLPAVLSNPRAHRARLCLLFVGENPGASNAQVAAGVGIDHKGHISQLLASLLRQGLLEKASHGPGRRNEWCLSALGEHAASILRSVRAGERRFTYRQVPVSVW